MTRDQHDSTHRSDRPSDQPGGQPSSDRPTPMAPGDQAPAGTPGTGENVCRMCGGKGRVDGATCRECQGTGTVVEGIGGA